MVVLFAKRVILELRETSCCIYVTLNYTLEAERYEHLHPTRPLVIMVFMI